MVTAFLDAFDQDVLLAHNEDTCHWTKWDELTGLTKVLNRPGPCDCPSATASCKPHGCYACANTKAVLGTKTAAERELAGKLNDLHAALGKFEDALASADEEISNGATANKSPEEVLADKVVARLLFEHLTAGDTKQARQTILNLRIGRHPSTRRAQADCPTCGECFDNKVARLDAEKKQIEDLLSGIDAAAPGLRDWYRKWTPTFSNTLLPVLKGAWDVVSGVMGGKYSKALDGAKELGKYAIASGSDGAAIYTFMKAVYRVGRMEADAIVGLIYHDRQAAAPTCGASKLASDGGEREEETPGGESPARPTIVVPQSPADVPISDYLDKLSPEAIVEIVETPAATVAGVPTSSRRVQPRPE